ncbi:MAG: AtpZ/AtpI family protein [Actinomycetota bacterium]|nr:AtpZ/AtpI family protein [Actinomycetota bacterium]
MSRRPDPDRRGFRRAVERRAQRRRRARERHESVWFGLGMFGVVGWSVALPTLIGIAIGAWVDARVDGTVSWTLTGLVLGVALGCLLAWFWVRGELPPGGPDPDDATTAHDESAAGTDGGAPEGPDPGLDETAGREPRDRRPGGERRSGADAG